MGDGVNLSGLPEPVRFELAKSTITTALAECIQTLGLSETEAMAALECVVSDQRAGLARLLAANVAQGSGLTMTEQADEAGKE